nr:putative Ig domain-containing protein [Pseudomonadota bacterium]
VATVTVNGKVTCQITGTPDTAATTTVYTITATNTAGASSATVTITINDPPPVVIAPALANIATPVTTLTGTAISPAIIYTNTGGNATTCTVDTSGSNADLPTGLSVATVTVNGKVTCQITGTPDTAATTTVYTITATNSIASSSATVTITVVSAPELANIATPVTAIAGNALNPAIVFTNTGGDAATCSVTDSNPSLPAGLMITTATDAGIVTCQITGTPNTATATSTYTITATNSGGPSSATVTITVVTTPALANIAAPVTAVAGTALSPAIVFANTGSDADSCAIDTSGANPDLPAGLMITTTTTSGKVTCQISGTPTVILIATPTTTATYTITATNIAGSSSATVMITVIRAPALANIAAPVTAVAGTALSSAIVFTNTGGDATNCQVNTSGGNPDLPASLSVAATTDVISGAVTCQISGTPNATTADTYTITASNAAGASSATVMITVNEPGPDEPNLSIPAPDMVVEAFALVPFVLDMINSGGDVEMDGCVVASTALLSAPSWMSAARYQQGDGTYSCRLTGTPRISSVSKDVVIEATNSGGESTTRFMLIFSQQARIADRTGASAVAFSRNVEQVVTLVNSGASVNETNSCMIDAAGDALPTGLSLRIVAQDNDRHTCAIGGLAMSVTASPLNVRIKATSASGAISTSNVELIVVAREPVLSDVSSITIVPGINVSDIDFANIGGDVQASNGCILAQGSPMLPAGLALARYRQADGVYSCQITGATTQNTASTTELTVAGVNSFGASEVGISITVEPGEIATTAPVLADIAQVQTFNIGTLMRVLFPNTGGNVAIGGCAISSGSLPSGLSVGLFRSGNTVTCGISGTPLVLTATSQLITVAAMNAASNGAVSSATVSIDVDVAIIDIDAPVISNLAAQTIIAGAIIKPIIFTNTGDSVDENAGGCALDTNSVALPLGLSLARVMHLGVATCQIIGLAQSANASPVTVIVNARNAGGLGSASVAITVSPAIVLNPPQLASFSAGPFTTNQDIDPVFFPNTGGDVSVDGCRLTAGSPLLPAGLMLVNAGLDGRQTCAISGAPTQIMPAGRTSSITATGADGTAIAEVTIVVVDQTPLLANIADAQSLTIGVPVADAIVFPNTGGDVQVDGCAVDSSAGKPMLPMGLSAIAVTVAGKVTCQITGTPGELSDEAVYTITAINSGNPGLAALATVTITVVAPAPNLANISGEHILNAGSAIIPLRFVNTGGSVSGENACTVTSLP